MTSKVYAGPLKMRLGPLKKRTLGYINTARDLFSAELTAESIINLRANQLKLSKSVDVLEQLNSEWAKLISLEAADKREEMLKDYNSHAEGESGFIALLDIARDLSCEIEAKLIDISAPINNSFNMTATHTPSSSIRLPICSLPTFNGKVAEWANFWSLFEVAIDRNNNLDDCEKLTYLMASLTRPHPYNEVSGFPVIAINYPLVVEHLKKRFGEPQTVRRSLYSELDKLCPRAIKLEDVRKNWISINRITQQLKALGEQIDNGALIQQIENKFGGWVSCTILEEQSKNPKWTVECLLEAINKSLRIKEAVYGQSGQNNFQSSSTYRRPPPRQNHHIFAQNAEANKNSDWRDRRTEIKQYPNDRQKEKRPCAFCEIHNHSSMQCKKYQNAEARIQRLKEMRKCIKCFERGHIAKFCQNDKIRCKNCGQPHYLAICSRGLNKKENVII
uniref:CCHC-type domain-containing protein n=1 Tax=Meloidogyne enterolobii TaxID=390850 RepID=A0A6V7Y8F1_MELEN|nr:unnamed protein product [Meloidogyne enterolobii]